MEGVIGLEVSLDLECHWIEVVIGWRVTLNRELDTNNSITRTARTNLVGVC